MFSAKEAEAETVSASEPAAPVAAEKKSFDIILTGIDPSKKLNIIKEVRSIFSIGLKDAKDLVEKPPALLKKDVPAESVDALRERLVALGCAIEVK